MVIQNTVYNAIQVSNYLLIIHAVLFVKLHNYLQDVNYVNIRVIAVKRLFQTALLVKMDSTSFHQIINVYQNVILDTIKLLKKDLDFAIHVPFHVLTVKIQIYVILVSLLIQQTTISKLDHPIKKFVLSTVLFISTKIKSKKFVSNAFHLA